MAKRHPGKGRNSAQLRSRQTRSSRGKLVADPSTTNTQLTEQLRALGLYAADTLGDGNCLFRALSDQIYGTESRHAELREHICDWIQQHKSRYAPFVEDERGLEVHLRCMREKGTYGGHLELSAFAHLVQRNVKVVQPGLVYVIEWASGGDPVQILDDDGDSDPGERERRRRRREEKRASTSDEEDEDSEHTVYVAYHDWEHFSSIRNLRGPHNGLPMVRESAPPPVAAPEPKTKLPKVKLKLSSPSKHSKPPSASEITPQPAPVRPSEIPLPFSRSPSPCSTLSSRDASTTESSSGSHAITTPPTSTSPDDPRPFPPISSSTAASLQPPRDQRSPKRSLDESSDDATSSGSAAKRSRSSLAQASSSRRPSPSPNRHVSISRQSSPLTEFSDDEENDEMDVDDDGDGEGTPALSAAGSSSSSTESSELPDEPDEEEAEDEEDALPPPPDNRKMHPARAKELGVERPLTRRERKALGLPKTRAAATGSPGKIIIPGGRYMLRNQPSLAVPTSDTGVVQGSEEWRRNGTGRVDVRGFRELKI